MNDRADAIALALYAAKFSQQLDLYIINSFFMNITSNPNQNSCAEVSTPVPNKKVHVSAQGNGWIIESERHSLFPLTGEAGAFVYTKPQEVAGAVLGLITQGVPFSGVSIPQQPLTPEDVAFAKAGEPFIAGGQKWHHDHCFRKLEDCIVELTKDLRSARGDAEHYRNYAESKSSEYVYPPALDQRDQMIAVLHKEVDRLNHELFAANEYRVAEENLNLEARKTIQKQCHEISRLGNEHDQALKVLSEVDALSCQRLDRINDLIHQRDHIAKQWQASDELVAQLRHRIQVLEGEVSERNKELCPPSCDVRVGDVWRSRNGEIRCVSEVQPSGRIEYQHNVGGGASFPRRATHVSEFLDNCEGGATVTRNAFVPARDLSGEPACGFMVGDRWTKDGGGIRIIVQVSDTDIHYDYRRSQSDDVDCICRCSRNERGWDNGSMGGATLVRK